MKGVSCQRGQFVGGQLSGGSVCKGISCQGGQFVRGSVVCGVSRPGGQLERGVSCQGGQLSGHLKSKTNVYQNERKGIFFYFLKEFLLRISRRCADCFPHKLLHIFRIYFFLRPSGLFQVLVFFSIIYIRSFYECYFIVY